MFYIIFNSDRLWSGPAVLFPLLTGGALPAHRFTTLTYANLIEIY